MIYLGSFSFSYFCKEYQEEKHGSFQIVVDCETPEEAERRFKTIIEDRKKTAVFLKGARKIFLDVFHELKKVPRDGAVLNFMEASGPEEVSVRCFTLNSSDGIKSYEWYPDELEPPTRKVGEEVTEYPFMTFPEETGKS